MPDFEWLQNDGYWQYGQCAKPLGYFNGALTATNTSDPHQIRKLSRKTWAQSFPPHLPCRIQSLSAGGEAAHNKAHVQ